MSVFGKLVKHLELKPTQQGKHGWIYLLLTALDVYETATPTADTFDNDFKEVLYRLAQLVGRTHAYQELAIEFGKRIE